MANPIQLCGRGLRYIRQYGPAQLYYKIKERRDRNRQEAVYDPWLKEQLPSGEESSRQRQEVFPGMPVISVLVPAYETPEEFLRQMIESVLNQSYVNLELCIADGSPSDKVRAVAEEYQSRDARVRYEKLKENKGISENTNAALAIAGGEYVGLLDHDDILLPGALYEVVKALNSLPGERLADAVYTDEDKVNMELTHHFQPHFKPDFNLDYLRSNNYICHFFVVRSEIARRIGGFQGDFDGAQDHDFIFRCGEAAREMLHVSKVLYSWRCHQASTASNPESKLYAYEAGKRAVAAHLKRSGVSGTVLDTNNYGFYRVEYAIKLRKSFENINGQSPVEVVYYDKACNNFVTFSGSSSKNGKEDYVLFTCVRKGHGKEGFWEELISCCAREDVGIACARVYDRDKRLANDIRMRGVSDPFGGSTAGLKEGFCGYFHRVCLQQELAEPTDCFLVKKSLLDEWKDFTVKEVAERVRKQGYKIVYNPWAVYYEDR